MLCRGRWPRADTYARSRRHHPATGMTPSEVQYNSITFDGRYSMVTYDGSQFSQLGRTFAASLNYRF